MDFFLEFYKQLLFTLFVLLFFAVYFDERDLLLEPGTFLIYLLIAFWSYYMMRTLLSLFTAPYMALLRKETPLPLALLSPPERERWLFETYVMPAVASLQYLLGGGDGGASSDVVKRIREFFDHVLGGAKNLDKIRNVLHAQGVYGWVSDAKERKQFEYVLATAIHWVYRYRNVVSHGGQVFGAGIVEAWWAFRTAMEYIEARYPGIDEAELLVRCKCGKVHSFRIARRDARWLRVVGKKWCRCSSFRVRRVKAVLDAKTIKEHLKLLKSRNAPWRN